MSSMTAASPLPSATVSRSDCTLDTCPVSMSLLGYQPQLAANAAGAAIFIICFLLQVFFGLKWRTWSYLVSMGCGCGAEALGYIGRLMLYNNPFSSIGSKVQIITLTFAPTFLAAGIYLNLKHLVLTLGPEFSRLRPTLYTWIFIGCDIVSIIVQAFGAGYAATDNANETIATNIILFGLSSQVFTLGIFGLFGLEVFYRERRGLAFPSKKSGWRQAIAAKNNEKPHKTLPFRLFTAALCLAFVTILIRCIYRIAEMAQGWGGSVMRNEALFIGLDEVMCIVATVSITVLHPGFCLPKRQRAPRV